MPAQCGPHRGGESVARRHGGEAVGRVGEEGRIGSVHQVRLRLGTRAHLTCLDGENRLVGDHGHVTDIHAGRPRRAVRRLPPGLAGAVVARMSNPPPNVSMSLAPLTDEPVMTAPVTRVKTTS